MGLVEKNQSVNGKWNKGFKSLLLIPLIKQDKTGQAKKGKYKEFKKKNKQVSPVLLFFTEAAVSIPVQGVSWQGLE